MKGIGRDVMCALFFGVVVPATLLQAAFWLWPPEEEKTPALWETVQPEPEKGSTIFFRSEEDQVREMDMEEYLYGAVLAEMPAWFEPEALKAQAVAARTYALKAAVTGGKHADGSVCGNFACCQAYISQEDYLKSGGDLQSVQKIRDAVDATDGLVLTYEEALIEATYYSCSGGRTEDAVAVWGTDFPYLRSVESPGEEGASVYWDTVRIPFSEFRQKLGLPGEEEITVAQVLHTSGGGVESVAICGIKFEGTRLRSLLGLRSTAMTIVVREDDVVITTRGFGHRVGMSQYGADAMAAAGYMYPEILAHYYPGTSLKMWNK